MKKQQLLREFFKLCPDGVCEDVLTEGEKKLVRENGALFLSGIIQVAETLNGNGRVYPKAILQREVTSYMNAVKEGRAVGELDHPDDSVVNLRNVSHKVSDCWWDGNNVMGKIQVLGTPAGQTLRALIEGGVGVGISSRGLGSVTESQGRTLVEDDYQLICFDIVQEPSSPGAFLFQEGWKTMKPIVENKKRRINTLLDEILR